MDESEEPTKILSLNFGKEREKLFNKTVGEWFDELIAKNGFNVYIRITLKEKVCLIESEHKTE